MRTQRGRREGGGDAKEKTSKEKNVLGRQCGESKKELQVRRPGRDSDSPVKIWPLDIY